MDMNNFLKKLKKASMPFNLREGAKALKLSEPTFSKYIHILAGQGKIRVRTCGSTILILGIPSSKSTKSSNRRVN